MKRWRYLWRTSSSLQLFRSINLKWWPLLITAFFVFILRPSESPTVLKFLSHRFPIDAVFQMKHWQIWNTLAYSLLLSRLVWLQLWTYQELQRGNSFSPLNQKAQKVSITKSEIFLTLKFPRLPWTFQAWGRSLASSPYDRGISIQHQCEILLSTSNKTLKWQ